MNAVKVSIVLFALAASTCAQPQNDRGLVLSGILKKVLENLRPSLKDLAIPNQNLSINVPQAQLSFTFDDGLVKGLDKFVINKLTTTLVPLMLTNLTLTLKEATLTGRYDLSGELGSSMESYSKVYGSGPAKLQFKGMFFTIASKFVFVNDKPQIPRGGLSGFDFYLRESKVNLENLLGGGEKGEAANKFFSFLIPDLVRDYKRPLFQEYKETIRCMINKYLAG